MPCLFCQDENCDSRSNSSVEEAAPVGLSDVLVASVVDGMVNASDTAEKYKTENFILVSKTRNDIEAMARLMVFR